MNKDDFARAMSLFETARTLPPEKRDSFLAGETQGHTEIRNTVEGMLAHDGAADDGHDPLIGAGAVLIEGLNQDVATPDAAVDLPGKEWVGRTIGQYRIVGVLGAGGMAVVFEAEQRQPARRVALKVLSTMLCTPDMLRRFEFEAEVLARLQHPHIAQIFDAGTLDGELTGRPFFVMELIDGEPLTTYARTHDLSSSGRLRLLVEV